MRGGLSHVTASWSWWKKLSCVMASRGPAGSCHMFRRIGFGGERSQMLRRLRDDLSHVTRSRPREPSRGASRVCPYGRSIQFVRLVKSACPIRGIQNLSHLTASQRSMGNYQIEVMQIMRGMSERPQRIKQQQRIANMRTLCRCCSRVAWVSCMSIVWRCTCPVPKHPPGTHPKPRKPHPLTRLDTAHYHWTQGSDLATWKSSMSIVW